MSALREVFARFQIKADSGPLQRMNKRAEGAAKKLAEVGGSLEGLPGILGQVGASLTGASQGLERLIAFAGPIGVMKAALIGAGAAAAYVTGQLVHLAVATADEAARLGILSQRLGLGTRQMQSWGTAVEITGGEADTAYEAFKTLDERIKEASEGAGEQFEIFTRLGVAYKDANGQLRDSPSVMRDLGVALAGLSTETEKVAIAEMLLGTEGSMMLPLITAQDSEFQKLLGTVDELGGGFSDAFVGQGKDNRAAIVRWNVALRSLRATISGAILPAVTWLIETASTALGTFSAWAKEVGLFRVMFASLSGALAAGFYSLAGIVMPILWGIARAVLAAAWPFVLFGLIVEDLWTLFEGGDSLIGRIIDGLFGVGASKRFVEWVKAAFVSLWQFTAGFVSWLGPSIGAVLAWVWEQWDWLFQQIAHLIIWLQENWDRLGGMLLDGAIWVARQVAKAFGWVGEQIMAVLGAAIDWLGRQFRWLWDVGGKVASGLIEAFTAVPRAILGAFLEVGKFVLDLFNSIHRFVIGGIADLIRNLGWLLDKLGIDLGIDIEGIADFIDTAGEFIFPDIPSMADRTITVAVPGDVSRTASGAMITGGATKVEQTNVFTGPVSDPDAVADAVGGATEDALMSVDHGMAEVPATGF